MDETLQFQSKLEAKPKRVKGPTRGFNAEASEDTDQISEPSVEETELVQEKQVEPEPEPESEAPKVRHHERLVRPMAPKKMAPKRGTKAAVKVRP